MIIQLSTQTTNSLTLTIITVLNIANIKGRQIKMMLLLPRKVSLKTYKSTQIFTWNRLWPVINHLMKPRNITWVFLKIIKLVENKLQLDKAKRSVTLKTCIALIKILDRVLKWTLQKKAHQLQVPFLEEKD